jgi:hypothetical protein
MASSYLNIVTFLLTTLFYYLAIKPSFTYEVSVDPKKHKEYISSNYMYLAIYLLLVMVTQFMVNVSIITSTCGGNVTENMGAAGVFTFLPWTLIFGVVILILTIYPGFKSAFSDVIGYFWISSSANKIITELLIDPNIQKKIDSDTNFTTEQKEAMQSATSMAKNVIDGIEETFTKWKPRKKYELIKVTKTARKKALHPIVY